MAYTLPNLSTATLLQSSKDKAIVIHQTPPSSSYSLLSLLLPSSPKPSSTLSPRFAQVNLTAPPAQDKRHNHRDDFFVNLGLAVRTLREDLPQLFTKDLNYDIYRDDITFMDPLNTFTGIERYKLIFWALRFHGKVLFREISLEVLRIWQPSENVILIRWNLKGVPRVPWETNGQFQGTSRYKLDRNGKIYEHKVDNLAFNFPQPLKPAATMLDLVAPCPTSPNPTFLWAPVDEYSSSWIEFYRAVKETLDRETLLIPQDCFVTCL